ncbi:MAG: Gfo/Idh/MocA family oxidoreductase [Candidatus Hydrogenedentes bacterium]|nr:Gfo/Idh/MocA family oxidoreductase [Candidatus Hydrogenedentota bacterium]
MTTSSSTRRQFLKRSTALAAAPMILSSGASGATAPSNRVGLALIGAGGRGNALVREFVPLGDARFLAVCDCFQERRERLRDSLNNHYGDTGVTAYADFREVLARDDIDAVIVATPDHWHVPIAIAAARAGKDMYVEKPLGVSMEWAWRLREAVRRNRRIFQYGTQQRSSGAFRQACELVRNGYLGAIERIDAWCPDISSQYSMFHVPQFGSTEPADPPEGFDYDMWLGPAPDKPYTVDRCTCYGAYHTYDYALGFIAGWGAHPLDIAQWGLGADETSPVRYEGAGSIPPQGLYDTIDSWDMTCTYAAGVAIRFMGHRVAEPVVSAYRPWRDHGTTFFGRDGWVSVDRAGMHASDPRLLEIALKPGDLHLRAPQSHAQDFVSCVKSRQPAISPLEAAIRSDTISHLCDIAIRLGRPITWDPDRERIKGDGEAADMLGRPLRAPWNLRKRMVS